MRARAICDGRGNAGTGARAVVLELEDGRVYERAEKLEPVTNIVAELLAIELAIVLSLEHGVTDLEIFNDSQVPVRLVDGTYKVRQEHLRPYVDSIWEQGENLSTVSLQWIPRKYAERADHLCREIDPKVHPGV